MITLENIITEYPKINQSVLPELLKQPEFEFVAENIDLLGEDETIDEYLNVFVSKLNEAVKKQGATGSQAKPKVKAAPKVKVKATPKPKVKAAPKAKKEPKPTTCSTAVVQKNLTEHFSEDVRLLRRFHSLVGKLKKRTAILAVYRDLEKRITERKVGKHSANAQLIEQTSKKLASVLKYMDNENLADITITIKDESNGFFDNVKSAANNEAVRTSVGLLKRFISFEGAISPDKAKIQALYKQFEDLISKGKVCENDLYFNEVKEAQKALKAYLDGNTKTIAISPTALNGVGSLGKLFDVAKTSNDILNGLFTPIDEVKERTTSDIEIKGDLGRFLGNIEKYELTILLRGDKGAGKSRLLFQLINAFAGANPAQTVGCFSLEMAKDTDIIKRYKDEYIKPENLSRVAIADTAPNGLDSIREAARTFDVVAVDSWGKIPGVKQEDFNSIRKEFPNTIFIFIFQSTTAGTARGGSMSEYDAGIVIQVDAGGRAVCEKNRYTGDNLTYLVFNQRIDTKE